MFMRAHRTVWRGHAVHGPGPHGHVHGEGGLAHGGAAGDDDEIGRLQAGGVFVELVVAGRHAGDHFLGLDALFDLLENARDEILGGMQTLGRL